MKTFCVKVGGLVEPNVLAIDLPVVVCELVRETGAHSISIIDDQQDEEQNHVTNQ